MPSAFRIQARPTFRRASGTALFGRDRRDLAALASAEAPLP